MTEKVNEESGTRTHHCENCGLEFNYQPIRVGSLYVCERCYGAAKRGMP